MTQQDILICIGAAIGANCIPCIDHLYEKARQAGVAQTDIRHAIELAEQVKKGAAKATQAAVDDWEQVDKKPTDAPCYCGFNDLNPDTPCGC